MSVFPQRYVVLLLWFSAVSGVCLLFPPWSIYVVPAHRDPALFAWRACREGVLNPMRQGTRNNAGHRTALEHPAGANALAAIRTATRLSMVTD